jgi:hypothetical protein
MNDLDNALVRVHAAGGVRHGPLHEAGSPQRTRPRGPGRKPQSRKPQTTTDVRKSAE